MKNRGFRTSSIGELPDAQQVIVTSILRLPQWEIDDISRYPGHFAAYVCPKCRTVVTNSISLMELEDPQERWCGRCGTSTPKESWLKLDANEAVTIRRMVG